MSTPASVGSSLLLLLLLLVAVCKEFMFCDAQDCLTWSQYEGQVSYGSTKKSGGNTPASCKQLCIETLSPDCVAVDFHTATSSCWVHTELVDLHPDNTHRTENVTQYRLSRDCTTSSSPTLSSTAALSGCINSTWRERTDTTAAGSVISFQTSTIDECLYNCSLTADCVAADINVNKDPVVCWIHNNPRDLLDSRIFSQKGTNHYQLVAACSPNCEAQWIVERNTNAGDATSYYNVTSADECRSDCTLESGCVAVDVSANTVPLRCWPHYDYRDLRKDNLFTQFNVTLYIPVKRCLHYVEPSTTTVEYLRPPIVRNVGVKTSKTPMSSLLVMLPLLLVRFQLTVNCWTKTSIA